MVLGLMTAEVSRPPVRRRALHRGRQPASSATGRKFFTDTALYTEDGELLGHAEQLWILIDLATFS